MMTPYDLTCRLAFLGHETEKKFLLGVSGQITASLNNVFLTTQQQEYRAFAPEYCVLYPATASNVVIKELVAQACKCSSSPKIVLLLLDQNSLRLEKELNEQGISVQVIALGKPNEYRAAELLVSFLILEGQIKSPAPGWKFVGASPLIHEVHNLIDRFARFGKDPVLITGETGTGKELIARRLHALRGLGEFRPYNAAEFPLELCVSLLCGSARGSYTGAVKDNQGYIMEAGDGTLFIDEIGDVQPAIQAILLRILQERKVVRLGDDVSQAKETNARFVFATNRDLQAARQTSAFREDLFQRISALQIDVPPLRKRLVDIPLLVKYFVKEFADEYKAPIDANNVFNVGALFDYDWKGNVRELRNVVRRAAALTSEGAIDKNLAVLVESKLKEKTASESTPAKANQRDGDSYSFLKSLLTDTRDGAINRFKKAYEQNLILKTIGSNKAIKGFADVKHTTAWKIKSSFSQIQFKPNDLVDPISLVTRLKHPMDPVSRHLHEQLHSRTKHMLNDYSGGDLDSSLMEALIDELNQQLLSKELPQAEWIHEVQLSVEARNLIKLFGWRTDLFRLNRLIIEDTYPDAISRCASPVNEPPQKTKRLKITDPTSIDTTLGEPLSE